MPDWSASSPFLAEVYDEQQLLQQRDMLFRRREELRKQRDKLKLQQQQPQEEESRRYRPVGDRESLPNSVSGDSNPLIPRPVIDETEQERQQLPAESFHNSGKRVSASGGSGVSYIARDTVFNDKEGTDARSIPVSSFESYRHSSSAHQQPSYREPEYHSLATGDRNLRRESEQGRSPDAIRLHYFSRVRQ